MTGRPEREALAATFDEDAELYDRVRPGYPERLFADLAGHVELGRVLEIGSGTGQATGDLSRRSARVAAVEPGRALFDVARRRLADLPNVEHVNASFEELAVEPGSFDVVASFTAWHWLDPGVRASARPRPPRR